MNSRSALPHRRIKVHDGYFFIERRKRKKNRVVSHVSSVSINFSSVSSPSSFLFPFTSCFDRCTIGPGFSDQSQLRKEQQLSMTGSIRSRLFLFKFDSYLVENNIYNELFSISSQMSRIHKSQIRRGIIMLISRTRSEHYYWSSDSRGREKHVVRKTELGPRDVVWL